MDHPIKTECIISNKTVRFHPLNIQDDETSPLTKLLIRETVRTFSELHIRKNIKDAQFTISFNLNSKTHQLTGLTCSTKNLPTHMLMNDINLCLSRKHNCTCLNCINKLRTNYISEILRIHLDNEVPLSEEEKAEHQRCAERAFTVRTIKNRNNTDRHDRRLLKLCVNEGAAHFFKPHIFKQYTLNIAAILDIANDDNHLRKVHKRYRTRLLRTLHVFDILINDKTLFDSENTLESNTRDNTHQQEILTLFRFMANAVSIIRGEKLQPYPDAPSPTPTILPGTMETIIPVFYPEPAILQY